MRHQISTSLNDTDKARLDRALLATSSNRYQFFQRAVLREVALALGDAYSSAKA